jgi:hypothetical protein
MDVAKLLQSALVPSTVLGGSAGRMANRAEFLDKLARYRRLATLRLVALYGLAIIVAVASLVMVLVARSRSDVGVGPYLGGAAFVGLLEWARRLMKDWVSLTLPLVVAPHASDEQLAELIGSLLASLGARTSK